MKKALLLLIAAACTTESEMDSVSETKQYALAANALAANALTSNALAANALAANALAANALAANALAANGFTTGAISNPEVSFALEDPSAQIFMKYLIECALDPTQSVTWASRRTPLEPVSWQGALGLCPTWQTGAPDQGCRERVSACLLARNNSFAVSVPLSMRGQRDNAGSPLELASTVTAHDRHPWSNSVVASSTSCPFVMPGHFSIVLQPYGDAWRACGWKLDKIGVCLPGTMVSIAAGAYAHCNGEWLGAQSFRDEMLRVCPGTSACDAEGALASVNDSCPGTGAPMIDFQCPSEGLYAVMQANASGSATPNGIVGSTRVEDSLCRDIVKEQDGACFISWDAHCEALAETACRYPATEKRVFRWKEGAFYGDIFAGLNPLKPQVRVSQNVVTKLYEVQSQDPATGVWNTDNGELSRNFVGVVYPQMYACSSRNWVEPAAYIAARVCAGPDPKGPWSALYTKNCAAQYVDHCDLVCETQDEGARGDWGAGRCRASRKLAKKVWKQPITTFVAQPCSIVPGTPCTPQPFAPVMGW